MTTRHEEGIRGQGAGIRRRADELMDKADDLLAEILELTLELAGLQDQHNQEAALLAAKYEYDMRLLRADLEKSEKTLLAMMKDARKEFFSDTDVVTLRIGVLLRKIEDKVKIPRDALVRCEELGFDEAIKIVKSLDRGAVEKWPDEKLLLIGAERKPTETFNYELKK